MATNPPSTAHPRLNGARRRLLGRGRTLHRTVAPVCVLSVGRSGTSLAARALGLLGLNLGDESAMMPASPDNPKGYWEHMGIYRVNEAVLEHFGGSWYEPPVMPSGWERLPEVAPLVEDARAIVADLGAGGARWAFKDPRSILTLPLWERVAGDLTFVVCLRRPQDMIDSVRQTGLEGAQDRASAQLWLDMNARALRETIDRRRTLLFYDRWFSAPETTARSLSNFVWDGDSRRVPDGAIDDIVGFFDPDLARSNGARSGDDVASGEPVELYALMEAAARRGDPRRERAALADQADALAAAYRARG